jgi:hypothetical protein
MRVIRRPFCDVAANRFFLSDKSVIFDDAVKDDLAHDPSTNYFRATRSFTGPFSSRRKVIRTDLKRREYEAGRVTVSGMTLFLVFAFRVARVNNRRAAPLHAKPAPVLS